MKDIEWSLQESTQDGKRRLDIVLGMKVRAYVRQTRMTRFSRDFHGKYAREYIENQHQLRDTFTLLMKKHGQEMFGKVRLGCSISVYGPTASRPDLSNVEKAVEDAANKSVWIDDRYIYERSFGKKEKAPEDRLELSVWELV